MYTIPRYLPAIGVLASSLAVYAKQHVIAPDTCAYVSANLYRLVGIPVTTIDGIQGDLEICLCQSSVDGARGFVATNPISQLAANDGEYGIGEDKVINALMYYIASQGSTCTYPDNGIPICTEEFPCDFGCSHGFSRVGDTCACPATMNICGGYCQDEPCTNSAERLAKERQLAATKTVPVQKKKKNKRSPQPSKRAPQPSKRAPQPSKRAPAPSKRAPAPSKRAPAPSKRAPAPSKRAPQPSKRAPAPSKRAPAPSKRAPAPSKRAPAPAPSKRAPQPSKRAPQPSKRAPAPAPEPIPEPEPELYEWDELVERAVDDYDDDEFDEFDEYDWEEYEEYDGEEEEEDDGYFEEYLEEAPMRERDFMLVLTEDRCRVGQSLCGGWRKGVDEWECLDTSRTLDSCGGCIYPYYLDENPKIGVDCSSLPGVVGVECRNSSCFVYGCADGYVLSPAMDECIRTH